MEFVTLNTSLREQNHHQFKKADDAPQKNIILTALLQKENMTKRLYTLTKKYPDADKYFYWPFTFPADKNIEQKNLLSFMDFNS